ncbi:MAG: type II secretion system F family protein [Vulcanimicrobiota bacterium]
MGSYADDLRQQLSELLPTNRPPRANQEELTTFTRQLAAMLESGIPLFRAVDFMADSLDDNGLRRVLREVASDLAVGKYYSKALSNHPQVFKEAYCAVVQTGEASGQLSTVMVRLADLMERQLRMRKKLISVLTYPAVLTFASAASIVFFMVFLLPQVQTLFDGLNVRLPLPTRIVLGARAWIMPGLTVLALGAVGLWLARPYLRNRADLRRQIHRFWLELPIIGTLAHKMSIAEVLVAYVTMLEAGLTVVDGLTRAASTAGNSWVKHQILASRQMMFEGENLSDALRTTGVVPDMVLHLLTAGEESGDVPLMVRHAAHIYEEEVELSLESFSALLEPILMVVMGLLVGFIVLSAILPTVELIKSF